jgi:predicted  nucleic acid-binding Zn-ribbon protein
MSAALNLYRLQQADTRLAQAHTRWKSIQAALEDDSTTAAARESHRLAREARAQTEAALREAEFQAQATRTKIEQAESSLYGGRVSNPKELQDLQKDSESLRRHLAVLEDSQLEAMLAVEQAEQAEASTRAALDLVLASSESDRENLAKEQGALKAEIDRLESERQAIAQGIDPASLQHYDTLRSQKRGIAVAAVVDGTCNACGGPLTPAERQAVHIGQSLVHCPTCGRLLYAG